MMPARCYRTLPLLGSQPVRPFHWIAEREWWDVLSYRPSFQPYQPSDWGALGTTNSEGSTACR